jgi:uncharacterized membrane protein (DUF485 family)
MENRVQNQIQAIRVPSYAFWSCQHPLSRPRFSFSFVLSYLCLMFSSPLLSVPLSFLCTLSLCSLPLSWTLLVAIAMYLVTIVLMAIYTQGTHLVHTKTCPLVYLSLLWGTALALACVPSSSPSTLASVPLRASASPTYCLSPPLQLSSL